VDSTIESESRVRVTAGKSGSGSASAFDRLATDVETSDFAAGDFDSRL
jgi:hypothetical protein